MAYEELCARRFSQEVIKAKQDMHTISIMILIMKPHEYALWLYFIYAYWCVYLLGICSVFIVLSLKTSVLTSSHYTFQFDLLVHTKK